MPLPNSVLVDLSRRYCEPHRRYHTIEHIADMLWKGRDLRLSPEQVLAVWYHDAIYKVPSTTNEADSAALAAQQLGAAGWPTDSVDLVRQIVLDTVQHEPSCDASAAVLDLDLSSLASDWPRFRANTDDIRAEYSCYSDDDFYRGQREVFERFLARDRIYHTSWGAGLEATARANLARAIDTW